MTHGSITTPFDVNLPLAGTPGIECRSSSALGAGNYMMVFTFPNNLTSVAGATVTSHNPSSASGMVSTSGIDSSNSHNYIVNLTGVSNQQYLAVTLNSVVDAAGNTGNVTGPKMGVLVGDVTANRLVDGNDVSAVQSHTRQPVTGTTFQFDVTANGLIDGNDVSTTQGQTRTSLPSSP